LGTLWLLSPATLQVLLLLRLLLPLLLQQQLRA
jgi:hypothetical protein